MLKGRLRSMGMRVTAPRLAVLAAVHHSGHLSVDAVATVARERLGSLSQQAVYDNLHALMEAGLVRRIEPANAPALFEARVGDNHHHLVCRQCGRSVEVSGPEVEAWAERVAAAAGYTEVSHTVEVFGLCPQHSA